MSKKYSKELHTLAKLTGNLRFRNFRKLFIQYMHLDNSDNYSFKIVQKIHKR